MSQDVIVGLRIDVDTLRGTRIGVPRLVEILAAHGIRASFFFSIGPDNMGRHLWRLIKPRFFLKMLRSRAANLYGWDILLRGAFWPGPLIGEHAADAVRLADQAGHEIGLHAWDHYRWQTYVESMSSSQIRDQIQRGMDALEHILNRRVDCSAVAGWRCTPKVLLESNRFNFRYSSDCRGTTLFRPLIDGTECLPQIPVTLPTYDELIGHGGISDDNFNHHLLSLIKPGRLNVLTIHAEVEGIARFTMLQAFLSMALSRCIRFVPLGELLQGCGCLPFGTVESGQVRGREGTVCCQRELN